MSNQSKSLRMKAAAVQAAATRRSQRGFTLTELMVTVAVFAVLLSVAIPSFDAAGLNAKLSSYANSLVATTMLARNEAIKRNAAVTLCPSANGSSCSGGGWEQGWILTCSSDGNSSCKLGGEFVLVLQKYPALSPGYKILNGNSGIDFQPTGIGITNMGTMTSTTLSLVVCRASPLGHQERTVLISSTGRASAAKTSNGSCG